MKKTTVSFTASDGTLFYMQCYLPFHAKERGTAAALILPAGKCSPDDYNWISGLLCRRGYLVYALYQRGYGSGIPLVNDNAGPVQKQDMRDAFHFMKEQPLVDPRRIVVIGHSNGASMMQQLAVEEDFSCGVALSQLSDRLAYAKIAKEFEPGYYERARQMYDGDPYENPEGYIERSCLHLADRIRIPILAITGDRDFITPCIWAERMTKALNDAGNSRSECVIIEDAGHFFEHYGFHGDQRTEVAEIIVEWIQKVMPAEG